MPDPAGICVTDLDGTLLHSERRISDANIEMLHELGKRGVIRIIATGRSFYSSMRVLPPDMPVDYVIFSTGAGIMDWQSRCIISKTNLDFLQITQVVQALNDLRFDYAIHFPIPETHRFHYVIAEGNADFASRCQYYADFALPLNGTELPHSATQFLAITGPENEEKVDLLRQTLSPMTVIRTTSPLDFRSLWIEVYATGVNKGNAVLSLAQRHRCPISRIMVIGNDYNDLDMLRLGGTSYVTANAPQDLRDEFPCVAHHDDDAFAEAVTYWLANR